MRTPYTYYIAWPEHNLHYYGVRYRKGCHPNDFWVSYFTSSEIVRNKIKELGEPPVKQVRKVFEGNKEGVNKARTWEEKVLRKLDVLNRTDWLNANVAMCFTIEASAKGGSKTMKNRTNKENSSVISKRNKTLLENNKHEFQNPIIRKNNRKVQDEMHKNGTHPFSNKKLCKERAQKRVREGNCILSGDGSFQKENNTSKAKRANVQVLKSLAKETKTKLGQGYYLKSDEWINQQIEKLSNNK